MSHKSEKDKDEGERRPHMWTPVSGRAGQLPSSQLLLQTPQPPAFVLLSPAVLGLERGAGLPLKVTVPVCTHPTFKGRE